MIIQCWQILTISFAKNTSVSQYFLHWFPLTIWKENTLYILCNNHSFSSVYFHFNFGIYQCLSPSLHVLHITNTGEKVEMSLLYANVCRNEKLPWQLVNMWCKYDMHLKQFFMIFYSPVVSFVSFSRNILITFCFWGGVYEIW